MIKDIYTLSSRNHIIRSAELPVLLNITFSINLYIFIHILIFFLFALSLLSLRT